VIVGFADKGTEDIAAGVDSKAARRTLPMSLWTVARRKLDYLSAATEVRDLRAPPGNRPEKLRGDLVGHYSIRINDQFRIVFHFAIGNASNVQIVDYH
jgi:proteic killer suppression protein